MILNRKIHLDYHNRVAAYIAGLIRNVHTTEDLVASVLLRRLATADKLTIYRPRVALNDCRHGVHPSLGYLFGCAEKLRFEWPVTHVQGINYCTK